MIDSYAITDVGSFRKTNQDAYYIGTNKDGDTFAVVCDGIGGGKAGDVASNKTIEYIKENFHKSGKFKTIDDAKKYICGLIRKCSEYIYDLSTSNFDYLGMGTTISGIYIGKYGNFVINLGDSRTYGVGKRSINCLTVDDSLLNEMLKNGEINEDEVDKYPDKHCIVRAIGIYPSIEPKITSVKKYDYYLACSDGLHGYVNEDKIQEVVSNKETTLKQKCEELLSLSLLEGGYDNITVVLLSCPK